MMVEIAVVYFYICTIATSDKVTYFDFLFQIAVVLLWNFVDQQLFLNKLQKALYFMKISVI